MKHLRLLIHIFLWMIVTTGFGGCKSSISERGLWYQLSVRVFESVGIMLFDADEQLSLKDVHLDGAGLLNREVFVSGKVEIVGAFGTFVVISEDRIRMLIDLSHLGGLSSRAATGDTMRIIGKVQSGEKGHFYLVANAVSRG